MYFVLCAVLGYFFGSIPFGLLLTKWAGLGDIRKIGSGNIGATNVQRTGRNDLAILTILLDGSKAGVIALICGCFWGDTLGLVAGFFGVLGHNFSVWLHFKGGKGVASSLGVMLFTAPKVGVLAVLTWILTAYLFKYSSLAALVALALAPIYALFLGTKAEFITFLLLAILSYWRHKDNIKRLLKHQESKINLKHKQ